MSHTSESEMGPLVPAKCPLQMHRDALHAASMGAVANFRKRYWEKLQQELGATDLCEIPDEMSARLSTMLMAVDARMSCAEEGIGAMTREQYADYATAGGTRPFLGSDDTYLEARIEYLQKAINRDAFQWTQRAKQPPTPTPTTP